MKILDKSGAPILSWTDWVPPRGGDKQWVEGRSAMEIARAFFREGTAAMPRPLNRLLESSSVTAGFVAETALPEFETKLPPRGSSGPRNHDVLIRGHAGARKITIGIEAKADEPFDGPLSAKQAYAQKRVAEGKNTTMPERLSILGKLLFGSKFDLANGQYSELGHQLIAGVAGSAIQADIDGADVAVFVVYEFRSRGGENASSGSKKALTR